MPLVGQVPGDQAGVVPLPLDRGKGVGLRHLPVRVAIDVVLAGRVGQARDLIGGQAAGLVAHVQGHGVAGERRVAVVRERRAVGHAVELDRLAIEDDLVALQPALAETEPLAGQVQSIAALHIRHLDGQHVQVRLLPTPQTRVGPVGAEGKVLRLPRRQRDLLLPDGQHRLAGVLDRHLNAGPELLLAVIGQGEGGSDLLIPHRRVDLDLAGLDLRRASSHTLPPMPSSPLQLPGASMYDRLATGLSLFK